MKVWIPHTKGRDYLGELPDDTVVEVYRAGDSPPSDPASVDFWVPPFLAGGDVPRILREFSGLKVVQLLSAGAEVWVGKVPDGVVLCNAKGTHTGVTAEWTVGAILADMRRFADSVRDQDRHEWRKHSTPTVTNRRVLVVGAGDIGEHTARVLETLGAHVTRVARKAREGVHAIAELDELLPEADVVALTVPLTDQTRGMVDARFLSLMRDGSLLVNAARGPVVDTDALVAEGGRVRAFLDVTDPEPLPAGHPLWDVPGVTITPHIGGSTDDLLEREYIPVGDQIRRLHAGEPLRNTVLGDY